MESFYFIFIYFQQFKQKRASLCNLSQLKYQIVSNIQSKSLIIVSCNANLILKIFNHKKVPWKFLIFVRYLCTITTIHPWNVLNLIIALISDEGFEILGLISKGQVLVKSLIGIGTWDFCFYYRFSLISDALITDCIRFCLCFGVQ